LYFIEVLSNQVSSFSSISEIVWLDIKGLLVER